MKNIELYQRIKNPLEESFVIDQLIEAYVDSYDYYEGLIKRFSKNRSKEHSKTEADAFYSHMFNTWKKELLSITPSQYEDAIKRGLFDRDILKLVAFLKTVPTVKTAEEAKKILNSAYEDSELEQAMEKYRWDGDDMFSSWLHIKARRVTGKKVITEPVEHRLYINANNRDIHKLSRLFVEKCTRDKIPYYFKISEHGKRDDNIVIYSSTKTLQKLLGILNEIEREHPDIISRCGRPPVLTGRIGSWIGYGSEPLSKSGEESFNTIRAKSIKVIIENELRNWYKDHLNYEVIADGKRMSISDYIAKQATAIEIDKMRLHLRLYKNSPNTVYTAEDLNDPTFIASLEQQMRRRTSAMIRSFANNTKETYDLELQLNGKTRKTTTDSITAAIKQFSLVIKQSDPDFSKKIRNGIIRDAAKHGIDYRKYCFDVENVQLLLAADKEAEHQPVQKQQTQSKESPSGYRPMTDEEIREAQRKLAEIPISKIKIKTTQ